MWVVRLTMCKSLNEGCADSAPSLMHRETDQMNFSAYLGLDGLPPAGAALQDDLW
jgi:hypothetical protein